MAHGLAVEARGSTKMSAEELKWQAEGDVRTLKDAAEIRKSPARLKRARAEAKRQMAALNEASKD